MKKKLFLLFAVISSILSSCAYEELSNIHPTPPSTRSEVKFSSNVLALSPSLSRAEDDSRVSKMPIGIFMLGKEHLRVVEGKGNVKYVTASGGSHNVNLTAADDVIYFPDSGEGVRFMSYYPYRESMGGNIYKVDVTLQTNQHNLDLLYSFNPSSVYDKTFDSQKVPMIFEHQLTKIYINVKPGVGLQGVDLAGLKVSFSGLSTRADFNLLTGKLSNFSGMFSISPSVLIAGNGNVYSCEAIVIPTAKISDAKIVFDLKKSLGSVYTWSFREELKKGTKYTYNVTVNRTGIVVDKKTHDWFNISLSEIIYE